MSISNSPEKILKHIKRNLEYGKKNTIAGYYADLMHYDIANMNDKIEESIRNEKVSYFTGHRYVKFEFKDKSVLILSDVETDTVVVFENHYRDILSVCFCTFYLSRKKK
jgi:hypothetical protein